jgi:Protein of unknown function (DUF2934)
MAKSRTIEKPATATGRAPKSATRRTDTASDVSHRAYDLYLARDCQHGHDVEDWLQAERESRTGSTAS